MPFNREVSNVKLKASDNSVENCAVRALGELMQDGTRLEVIGSSLPMAPDLVSGHLQGVAVPDSQVLLTSSVGQGYVMSGRRRGLIFTIEDAESVEASHPGGIQAIGSYFAVPVHTNDGGSEIRFYGGGLPVRQLTAPTIRRSKRANCVGITDCGSPGSEFYVLAVGVTKNQFDFYKSQPGIPLDDPRCRFERVASWNAKNVSKAARASWRPDKKWGGYGNNISLLADDAGKVYFLGMHKTGFLFFDFLGRDYADLYLLDLDTISEDKRLTKLDNLHVRCHDGTSFRWGASVSVVADDRFRIYVCERNVMQNGDSTKIRLNAFHAQDDAISPAVRIVNENGTVSLEESVA